MFLLTPKVLEVVIQEVQPSVPQKTQSTKRWMASVLKQSLQLLIIMSMYSLTVKVIVLRYNMPQVIFVSVNPIAYTQSLHLQYYVVIMSPQLYNYVIARHR